MLLIVDMRFVKPKLPQYWTNTCQILSSNVLLSLYNPNTVVLGNVNIVNHKTACRRKISENWNKCTENELGEDCVPCQSLDSNYCQNPSRYCQLVEQVNGTITNECYCPPGYEGEFCESIP